MSELCHDKSDLRPQWAIAIPVFIAIVCIAIPAIFFPDPTAAVIQKIFVFFQTYFGTYYLWLALFLIIASLYFAFSKYGMIKFGEPDEEPEYSNISWFAMIFTSGVAGAVLYWAVVEPSYYIITPPHYAEPHSIAAYNLALPQVLFHWGPHAWATYFLPSLPICYILYIKKLPLLRISAVMEEVLGIKSNSPIGYAIDVFFIIGLLLCTTVTMLISIPTVASAVARIFDGVDPNSMTTKIYVLGVSTCIYTVSVYLGISKGIKWLSNINVFIALGLVAYAFCTGPTMLIISSFTDAFGRVYGNYISLSLWTDPWGQGGFPQAWDIFYVLFWAGYGAFMALFIARVSRGRTIRQIVLLGFAGACAGGYLIHGVFGTYTLHLIQTGAIDLANYIGGPNRLGEAALLMDVLGHLPGEKMVYILYAIFSTAFLATSADAGSFIIASTSTRKIVVGDQPHRCYRLFWALSQGAMVLGLLYIGGLEVAKQFGNFAGASMAFPVLFLVWCWFRIIKQNGHDLLRTHVAKKDLAPCDC